MFNLYLRGIQNRLFLSFERKGLVFAARGPGGGYYLSHMPESIKLSEIMNAVGEDIKITRCDNDGRGCLSGQSQCTTHSLWDNFGNYIKDYLSKISLSDVVNKNFDFSSKDSRLLPKFAYEGQVTGVYGTENQRGLGIHEDLSVETTKQFSSEVEFQKKSHDSLSDSSDYVYADYNSTAPVSSCVKDDVLHVLSKKMLNPSAVHKAGQKVRKIMMDTRDDIYRFIGVSGNREILFTSSATEANNLVMRGMKGYSHVISAIEHPSVINSANNPYVIPVDHNGVINLAELEKILHKLKGSRVLVSVMMANNETGVVQPIKEIVRISHSFGAICHTDAVQACGKINLNIEDLEVDLLTLSAHKIGGLTGAGALIFNPKLQIEPIITGGGQEKGLRAGTENVIAIASFSSALRKIPELLEKMNKVKNLRDQLESKILKVANNAIVFGKDVGRLPNTSCIYMPGVKSDIQLMSFDSNNIAVSSGAACSSGRIEPSHVLLAMGVTKKQAECSIRISIGWDTTTGDIDRIIGCWYNIYKKNVKL